MVVNIHSRFKIEYATVAKMNFVKYWLHNYIKNLESFMVCCLLTCDIFTDILGWCEDWRQHQHIVFQLANCCCVLAFGAPSSRLGVVFTHSLLVVGKYDSM